MKHEISFEFFFSIKFVEYHLTSIRLIIDENNIMEYKYMDENQP